MDSVSFTVRGIPAPKGSVTRMKNGAYLPAGTAASRMNFQLWKENVTTAARVEMGERRPWYGAIRLMAEFRLPVPATTIRKHQMGWWPHIKRPDVDKLTRALLDPLKGIVWADDSQVCFCTVNKVYAWEGNPGAVVVVDFLTADYLERYGKAHQAIVDVIESL